MNNTEDFSGADFGKYLLESQMVAAGKEKFIVHWTRKFFEYRLRHPQIVWSDLLPLYLKELDSTGGYKDWQIRQADQAVRLYFSNYLTFSFSKFSQWRSSSGKYSGIRESRTSAFPGSIASAKLRPSNRTYLS